MASGSVTVNVVPLPILERQSIFPLYRLTTISYTCWALIAFGIMHSELYDPPHSTSIRNETLVAKKLRGIFYGRNGKCAAYFTIAMEK